MSILPASYATVQSYVDKCPQEMALAFTRVLAVVCGTRTPDGASPSEARIRELAWTNARLPSSTRNVSENVVWLWIYTLMLITIDADIARLRGLDDHLSKRTILRMAIDLGQYLLSAVGQDGFQEPSDVCELTINTIQRTRICITTLARLHAISAGREESIGTTGSEGIGLSADYRALLSDSTAFLASK
jgi:hypothetical protein